MRGDTERMDGWIDRLVLVLRLLLSSLIFFFLMSVWRNKKQRTLGKMELGLHLPKSSYLSKEKFCSKPHLLQKRHPDAIGLDETSVHVKLASFYLPGIVDKVWGMMLKGGRY